LNKSISQWASDLATISSRLPTNGYTEAGGLMYYGANTPDLLQCAATYVDKILKDAKPDDLPVQQPKPFEPTSI